MFASICFVFRFRFNRLQGKGKEKDDTPPLASHTNTKRPWWPHITSLPDPKHNDTNAAAAGATTTTTTTRATQINAPVSSVLEQTVARTSSHFTV